MPSSASFRFDPTTLSRYGRLALVARNLVEGFLTGAHKSPYKGFSVEFAEHRQYYPGDEIRHIDWRAYGKTDRYYIKEYEEETNLRAHLVVDASGSMAYKGKHPSKFDYAQQVAASLAYLMLQQRDAVGLVTHDTQVRQMLPPRASTKHLLQVLRLLENTRPEGETALAPLWDQIAARISRRGLVILLSDCFDEMSGMLKSLRHFHFRRHEVLLFHVLAPEEIEFPFRKWTQFRNLEDAGHKVLVDPASLRKEYRRNFDRYLEELRKTAASAQVDYHLLRTDQPVERALGVYLARRQSRR
jgi:uncharacterized protein (DUF58 family)